VLFAAFYTFVAFAFVFQLVPPLIEPMTLTFNLGPSEEWLAGFLMSIVVIPGIFLALPAGRLVDKYGFKLIGLASIILIVVGNLLTSFADSFLMALLGRFVLGVGASFIITGVPTLIPQWFSRKDLGKAMGVYATNMPVATITAFLTASVLRVTYGWRYPFHVGTVVAISSVVVFAMIVKEGPLKRVEEPRQRPKVKSALTNFEIWKVGLVWSLFNTTAIAFLTWSPSIFERFRNFDPVSAGLLASVIMIAAIPSVPIFGWASDKIRRRKPFIIVGSFLMALALMASGFARGFSLLLYVIALGITNSMVPPLVMTMPSEIFNSGSVGIGFGILTICQNIGITFGPPLAGYLLASTGSMELTFIGVAMFALLGSLVASTLETR
jgi:MFS family permease